MTLRVSLLFQADAKAAKAEVDGLATSARKVGEAAQDMGRKAADGARGVDNIGRAADGAEAQLQGLTAAQQTNAAATTQLANSHHLAAGSTGNLAAQFNDIGMMLAAGQNPLQLAIQQGTQISQVIGPMGAAGAAKALGAAFIGMLSPINLITIGAIAAGAAMVQWLTGAGDEAVDAEEAIQNFGAALDDYTAFAAQAAADTETLRQEFGEFASEVRGFADYMAGISLGRSFDDLGDALGPMRADLRAALELIEAWGFAIGQANAADQAILGDAARAAAEELGLAVDQVGALSSALDAVEAGRLANDITAVRDAAADALAMIQEWYPAGVEVRGPLNELVVQLNEIVTATAEATVEMGPQGLSGAAQLVAGEIYGATDALSLLAAMEPDAGWLNGAINAASMLAGNLWNAVSAQSTLGAMGPMGGARPSGEGRGSGGGAPVAPEPPGRPEARPINIDFGYAPPVAAVGGGGAARTERDAVQELIDKLQEEVAILRETDPVQQELLRHRETLAKATDAERAEVEALITTRERERTTAEAVAESWDMMESSAYDALRAVALEGESATDVLRNLGAQLAEVLFQAAIMGEGPLGGIFGGTSIFSLMGSALGVPAKAKGGMIHGPGDGTSDDVLMYGSSGEFVVTADATARYRPVLEAMNAGAPLPHFAQGGMIGGGAGGGGAGGGEARPLQVTVDVRGARGDREIEEASYRGMQRALAEYDREVLPASVDRVSRDPWRRG